MTAIKEILKPFANKRVVAATAGVSFAVLLSLGSLMVAGGSDAPEGASEPCIAHHVHEWARGGWGPQPD